MRFYCNPVKVNDCHPVQLQIQILKKGSSLVSAEKEDKKTERETTLNERVPALKLSGLSVQDLQVCSDHVSYVQSDLAWHAQQVAAEIEHTIALNKMAAHMAAISICLSVYTVCVSVEDCMDKSVNMFAMPCVVGSKVHLFYEFASSRTSVKSCTRRLTGWMKNDTTLHPKFPKMKKRYQISFLIFLFLLLEPQVALSGFQNSYYIFSDWKVYTLQCLHIELL